MTTDRTERTGAGPRDAPGVLCPTPESTRALGRRLGTLLRAGDLVLLTGDLGAGKTTLAQGIGEGLGVRGPITSPTFVIARVHPSLRGGPDLVHVDAYRLGGLAELDDLDLDADAGRVVTLVEWGHGLAERLAPDRLEIALERSGSGSDDRQARTLRVTWSGERWRDDGPYLVAALPTGDVGGTGGAR